MVKAASCLASLALVAIQPAVASTVTNNISTKSSLGQRILSNARKLNDYAADYDFVADYSIKFQGCHHVQQWNDNVEDEDDVRVKTKRLVRFRLCPSDTCSNDKSAGCTSKFGDYVVDMNTFVEAYLDSIEEEKEQICYDTSQDCQNECDGNDNNYDSCLEACYDAYDASFCYYYYNGNGDGDNENDFDPKEFSQCGQVNFGRRLNDNNGNGDYEYFIGPYCADQGGEIHLGLFTDDTCTTYAQNGESTFYNYAGFELPYSDESLVSTRCFACGQENNNNGYYQIKELCENVYTYSGKCETRMDVDYPNESSCSYIEGIKIIREDGVIRTSTTKKSKAAAVCIGLFLTLAVLLAGYVYYLRTKLGRAQINLAAASQQMT